MTELLEKAIDEAKKLPDTTQDIIAKYLLNVLNLEGLAFATQEEDILQILDDELMWNVQFANSANGLEKLAQKALNDHTQGKTIPLDKD